MAGKRLTARFVDTVSTEADRIDFADAVVRGLALRVTKSGAKSWTLRYRRKCDGRLRRLTLGSFPAVGLDEARQLARTHIVEIGRGADPAEALQESKRAETFAEVAAEWMERHGKPNKSPRALRDDQSMLGRHVLPIIGGMKAVEIEKRDVLRLVDAVAAKSDARDVTGRRLTHRPNRVFELVRAIFRWAIGRDLLKIDPTLGVKPPIKTEKPRERELAPSEIRQLLDALSRAPIARRITKGLQRGEKASGADDLPMTRATALTLELALATAQRIGEVAGIALNELDLNATAPMWVIPGERTKNRQPNRAPLSRLAVRLIEEARKLAGDSPWLFPSASGVSPIDAHAPTKALERARPVIGLEDFRVHDLRRTAATRMAEMGISPHTISLVLNHVSARKGTITGAVYVQYSYDREKRLALDAWGARLERIVAGEDGVNVHLFGRFATI